MEHITVKSSNIQSIAYENGTLQIAFKSGKVYNYTAKSAKDNEILRSIYNHAISQYCKSVGSFLNKEVIKSNRWTYEHTV